MERKYRRERAGRRKSRNLLRRVFWTAAAAAVLLGRAAGNAVQPVTATELGGFDVEVGGGEENVLPDDWNDFGAGGTENPSASVNSPGTGNDPPGMGDPQSVWEDTFGGSESFSDGSAASDEEDGSGTLSHPEETGTEAPESGDGTDTARQDGAVNQDSLQQSASQAVGGSSQAVGGSSQTVGDSSGAEDFAEQQRPPLHSPTNPPVPSASPTPQPAVTGTPAGKKPGKKEKLPVEKENYQIKFYHSKAVREENFPKIKVLSEGRVQILSVRINGGECLWHWAGDEIVLETAAKKGKNEIRLLALSQDSIPVKMDKWEF